MKKLLLLAPAALMLASATSHASDIWTAQDRANWVITGCSQQNANNAGPTTDGGFKHIFDDNTDTFWHVSWADGTNNDHEANHYLIIDRGENAEPYNGFGYLPRQAFGGNGYVNEYSVYSVNEISATVLGSTCSATEQQTLKPNSHANMQAFLEALTPAASGSFDYTWDKSISGGNGKGDISSHSEQRVKLNATQAGRYLIFVVRSAYGEDPSASNVWANCAEFKTYSVITENVREQAQALINTAVEHLTPGHFSKEHPEYATLAEALAGNDDAALSTAYLAALDADLTAVSTTCTYTITHNLGNIAEPAESATLTVMPLPDSGDFTPSDYEQWAFVEIDGKYYLYNVRTLRFANTFGTGSAYEADPDKAPSASGHHWYANPEIGSAITIELAGNGLVTIKADGTKSLFVTDKYSNAENAAQIIDYSKAGDTGMLLAFTAVSQSQANADEITATLRNSMEAIDHAIAQSEFGENVVGHYTNEVSDKIATIRANYYAEKDFRLSQALSTDKPYLEFENGKVYTLRLADEDKWHWVDNGTYSLGTPAQQTDGNNTYWVCGIDEKGTHTFTHTVKVTGTTETYSLQLESAGENEFTAVTRSSLGLMRLTTDGADYEATLVSDNKELASSSADRTAIGEITTDGNATTEEWYDLTGRHVSSGARGFIISSKGNKVYKR